MLPYKPSSKLIRVGKYLLPSELLTLDWRGAPRPQRLASLRTLRDEYPELVSCVSLGTDPGLPASTFGLIREGQHTFASLPAVAGSENCIHRIRMGGSVGRNCCLIGPDNCVIEETGFYFDADQVAATLTFGKFHPHFWRYRWQGDLRFRWRLPKPSRISGCVAALNNRCAHNFYHWMLEIAPRIAALHMADIKPDWYLVDCQSRFQKRVLAMLGIAPQQLIQPHCNLFLIADEIVSPSEPGLTVLNHFVSQLKPNFVANDSSGNRKLYISRRKARHRRIDNELELEEALAKQGFETHCFEDYSVDQQFRLMQESRIIFTTHGAALANTIFAAPETDVIELFPDRRTNLDLYPNLSRRFGLRHQSVLVPSSKYRQNIHVDISHIETALANCRQNEPLSQNQFRAA